MVVVAAVVAPVAAAVVAAPIAALTALVILAVVAAAVRVGLRERGGAAEQGERHGASKQFRHLVTSDLAQVRVRR